MTLNKVILIGRLGQDPETRFSQAGLQITKFSLATSEKYKGEEQTEWHNVVTFGKIAEICAQYLAKGQQVYIEGRIKTSSWTGEDGIKKYRTEINATQMKFLGTKGNGMPKQEDQGDNIFPFPSKSGNDEDVPF